MNRRTISPWRCGCLWNLAILLLGGLAASLLVALPFIAYWHWRYGLSVPPGWATLRTVQIVENFVVGLCGAWWACRYFRSRYDFDPGPAGRWVVRFQVLALACCAALCLVIGVSHYGNPVAEQALFERMALSVLLVFGTLAVMLTLASRHFWGKLVKEREHERKSRSTCT